MRDIDLKSLRLLVAVCDHQNMARAAAQEHIEPSAVSKRIAQLEHDLGTPLLMRSRRGVQPTPAGLSVLEHARSVLFTMERMVNDASTFSSGVKGQVRLVATVSAIAESLLDDIAAFMREPANRNIKVDVEERQSRDVVRHLRDGLASVGVCWDSIDLEGLEHLPYRQDRLGARGPSRPSARRAASRCASSRRSTTSTSACRRRRAVHTMLHRAAARSGRTVSYRAVVSNFDASFRVVAANLAISVVPVEVGGPYAEMLGVKIIPLTDAWAHRRFAICFQKLEALQPPVRRLVEHLVQRAAQARRGRGVIALRGLALLLLFQAAGEALVLALKLPFPGPVVGLVLLLVGLRWPAVREPAQAAAELLLAHLSLLFVPVGVGVITHLDLVSRYGVQLIAVIVLSTWIGMAVTALLLRALLKRGARRGAGRCLTSCSSGSTCRPRRCSA